MAKKPAVAAKVGEWTAIAALATLVSHYIDNLIATWNADGVPWHHLIAVTATACVGGLVAIVQNLAADHNTAAITTDDDPDE